MKKLVPLRRLIAILVLLASGAASAQTTATGTINATLINKNAIALVFDTDPGGVSLGASGSSAASLDFGTISASGPLSPGVTRPAITATSFTVRSAFQIGVTQGGLNSTSYTLSASLASPAPTGLSYKVDAVTLTAAAQNIQTNGIFDADIAHNLDLVVSTAAPGAGGPAVGVPLATTINFTATAN
jgi:hypothetical protein